MMYSRTALCVLMLAAAASAQHRPDPDEILYDSGVKDVQQERFERARLTLQTLINTYDQSPLIPRAKLAIADSWYREGGARAYVEAEQQCKEVIADYPESPAAAGAKALQRKIQEARKAKEK